MRTSRHATRALGSSITGAEAPAATRARHVRAPPPHPIHTPTSLHSRATPALLLTRGAHHQGVCTAQHVAPVALALRPAARPRVTLKGSPSRRHEPPSGLTFHAWQPGVAAHASAHDEGGSGGLASSAPGSCKPLTQ
jgi:hypothetical protein